MRVWALGVLGFGVGVLGFSAGVRVWALGRTRLSTLVETSCAHVHCLPQGMCSGLCASRAERGRHCICGTITISALKTTRPMVPSSLHSFSLLTLLPHRHHSTPHLRLAYPHPSHPHNHLRIHAPPPRPVWVSRVAHLGLAVAYLRQAVYPVLRGAVQFFQCYLTRVRGPLGLCPGR